MGVHFFQSTKAASRMQQNDTFLRLKTTTTFQQNKGIWKWMD
jgi:hypothetical protein